jgi:hypothetical protein
MVSMMYDDELSILQQQNRALSQELSEMQDQMKVMAESFAEMEARLQEAEEREVEIQEEREDIQERREALDKILEARDNELRGLEAFLPIYENSILEAVGPSADDEARKRILLTAAFFFAGRSDLVLKHSAYSLSFDDFKLQRSMFALSLICMCDRNILSTLTCHNDVLHAVTRFLPEDVMYLELRASDTAGLPLFHTERGFSVVRSHKVQFTLSFVDRLFQLYQNDNIDVIKVFLNDVSLGDIPSVSRDPSSKMLSVSFVMDIPATRRSSTDLATPPNGPPSPNVAHMSTTKTVQLRLEYKLRQDDNIYSSEPVDVPLLIFDTASDFESRYMAMKQHLLDAAHVGLPNSAVPMALFDMRSVVRMCSVQ